MSPALFEFLLRLGDDRLVLGHQLSMWCSKAPTLEEDIALANMALDLLGQATALLSLAGKEEGRGRSADDLAFFRDVTEFRCAALVEQPNGDFAQTIVRQLLFSAFAVVSARALQESAHVELGGIAGKALKESSYHLTYSGEWLIRLGDGTAESHARSQRALDELWIYTDELFSADAVDAELVTRKIATDVSGLRTQWLEIIRPIIERATLTLPAAGGEGWPARQGMHSEHLGRMLSEMQSLARAHAGAKW